VKALILAAGRGTRVQPVTHTVPKPMIPILNRPVMEFLVDLLAAHGVRSIMVNTSYLATEIENYFRDGARFGVEIGYSFEGLLQGGRIIDQPVGSAGAIRRIQDHSGFFDEPFLVLCGDAIIDLDLTAFADFHRQRGARASLAALTVPRSQVSSYGIVLSGEDGRIRGFQEKPAVEEARSDLANTGVYLFEPDIVDRIPAGRPYDIGSQLFPDLVEHGVPFYAARIPFRWLDIGRLSDYYAVLRQAMLGGIPGFTPPGREIAPGIRVGPNVRFNPAECTVRPPVWIGASASIGYGSTLLGPCFIGPGSEVVSGAHIEESFVFDHTRVGRMAHLRHAIATGHFCVNSHGTAVEVAGADLDWILADSRSEGHSIANLEQLMEEFLVGQ
jgi:mannose-1-phosphate guanylyltransferase